jgi:hypothetical protein
MKHSILFILFGVFFASHRHNKNAAAKSRQP